MFKKIFAVCALAATVSFAEWDYFPILPQGHGQVVGSMQYTDANPITWLDGEAGVRYSLLSFMEVYMDFEYRFFVHNDGEDMDADGIGSMPVGVKFQLNPQFALFGDFLLPIGDEDIGYDYLVFAVGISHVNLYTNLAWGSELGVRFYTEDDVYDIHLGDEWDVLLGRFVPYFAFVYDLNIYSGPDTDDYTNGFELGFGAKFAVSASVTVDFTFSLLFGDMYKIGKDDPKRFTLAVFDMF